MRQIFLDTETTGLFVKDGHRVIEIAAVEMVNGQRTQLDFHTYINPKRAISTAAKEVHGITRKFLQDKPVFADIAPKFLECIKDAELIIHNAPFDIGFLNAELAKSNLPVLQSLVYKVTDTLLLAKRLRPNQRNNLDALCVHFGVDHAHRIQHGAMVDAQLLVEVYKGLTGVES
jgi:DNA polymerase III subunit epsilon